MRERVAMRGSGVERVQYGRDLMRTQDPMCHLSDCHTGTQSNLSITLIPVSVLVPIDPSIVTISVLNPIVIPTGICFTQTKMFCHLPKRMLRIAFLIGIGHFCPELCFFGEVNALFWMNFDSSHWSGATTQEQYPDFPGRSIPSGQSQKWHKINRKYPDLW